MHNEKVHYTNQSDGSQQTAEVKVYDTLAEATKELGEKGCLESVNEGLIEKAQRKLRHGNQLKRSQTKRAQDKAMREFAIGKGFDPTKIKV